MNRRWLLIGGVLLLVLILLGWWLLSRPQEEDRLTLYGNVDIREADLGFRVSGRLAAMVFEEGDVVAVGDILARLDTEPYREALAAAEARVDEARANLARLESGTRPQEIAAAEARVAEARADLANAEREFERQRILIESAATSRRDRDNALAGRDTARARLDSAQETLALAREGFRSEEIDAARAALALARAEADQARTRVDDATLLAPSDGVILSRIREPGSILAAGAPVYTLSLRAPVWVRAYVDEPNLGRLHPGMKALIRTDSRAEPYEGQIGFISPRAEFTPKTVETEALRTDLVYRLRVVVDEDIDGLRQGMPVTVILPDTVDDTVDSSEES